MARELIPHSDLSLWHQLIDANRVYREAQTEFITKATSPVALLRGILQEPGERAIALQVATLLNQEQLKQLFDDLLELCSFPNAQTEAAQRLILSLPRDWVLANIEERSERLLRSNSLDGYWQLLDLYSQLDRNLTLRLVQRAKENPDPEIREAGESFT